MKLKKDVLKYLDKAWWNKAVEFQNKKWYVYISLTASIITVFTLFAFVINLWNKITSLSEDVDKLQYTYTNVYNNQDAINTSRLDWWKIIRTYIDSLNWWDYQTACSLRATHECTMYDVTWFTNWVQDKKRYLTIKLRDGETLKDTWYSWEELKNTNTEIWCATVERYINNEDRLIRETRQYYILTRPDKNKEIWKILTEKAEKDMWNWQLQDRSEQMLWYVMENKICNK